MKYLVRSKNGQVAPCDEHAAWARLESEPDCYIANFGTNHWIKGDKFLEFGDAAFESRNLRVLLAQPDHTRSDLLITTETFPPFTVAARLGIVASERVAGLNILKDLAVGITDIVGGTSGTLQQELSTARQEVLHDMKRQGSAMGAHALIGLNLNFTQIEGKGTLMLLVAGWATAVTFSGES